MGIGDWGLGIDIYNLKNDKIISNLFNKKENFFYVCQTDKIITNSKAYNCCNYDFNSNQCNSENIDISTIYNEISNSDILNTLVTSNIQSQLDTSIIQSQLDNPQDTKIKFEFFKQLKLNGLDSLYSINKSNIFSSVTPSDTPYTQNQVDISDNINQTKINTNNDENSDKGNTSNKSEPTDKEEISDKMLLQVLQEKLFKEISNQKILQAVYLWESL